MHQIERGVAWGSLRATVVGLLQEVVADGTDMTQCLQNDVAVVVGLDIVQADHAGQVEGTVYRTRVLHWLRIQRADVLAREHGVEQELDVVEGRVDDLVVVGQAVEAQRQQVQEDVVGIADRMCVSVRVGTAALKVLAADEARVHVDAGERHRAQLLEVKVENGAVDGVQVGTEFGRCLLGKQLSCLDLGPF